MDPFDHIDAVLKALSKMLIVLSLCALMLALGWLFMANNVLGFIRCMALSLICALVYKHTKD